jgi:hypothetical protein
MVILRATSNLGGQKKDNGMMCSITLSRNLNPKQIQNSNSNSNNNNDKKKSYLDL